MKKLLWIAAAVLGISTAQSQENKTSLIAGYTNANLKSKVEAFDETESENIKSNGFFVGLTHQIDLSNQVSFVPGFIYTQVKAEEADESDNYIQVPLFLRYRVADKIAFLAGPKFEYLTNLDEELEDYINELSFGLGLGVEITIIEHLSFLANYSFQLNNSYTEDFEKEVASQAGISSSELDITAKHQFINLGLAYKF
ncbi:outer membrane beta-barrel protein [Ochrovirga pacifica]|uniref:outer membrane beta-barrel protein n=1 Tax=Ochrovirga pacifica TaxID=1042376 RepID=UPI000255A00D|nr:outer membrane beta-barrel protein [Ochrovirga pacifica]